MVFRFQGVGWRYNRYNGTRSEKWTVPGGWGDCDSRVTLNITVPVNSQSYNSTRTVALDPLLVKGWLTSNMNGQRNYGLLLRAITGGQGVTMMSNLALLAQRPALRVRWSTISGISPQPVSFPVTYGAGSRSIWVDATLGDDLTGIGSQEWPYKSLLKATTESLPGDVINLMSGLYFGGVSVWKPHITLRSAPGNWAVISSTLSDPIDTNNVLTIRSTAHYTVIKNLEITGELRNLVLNEY